MDKLSLCLILLAAVLLATACSRDPYARYKPGQLLDEGQRMLRSGDLAGAEKLLRMGLERAENIGINVERSRPAFITPLFHMAMKRGDLKEAQKLLARMGPTSDTRSLNNIAVVVHRSGKLDEARSHGEVLARAMAANPPTDEEERAMRVAAWTTVDRLRTARFDRDAAREASDAVVAALIDVAEPRGGGFRPLPPGLRGWTSRYIDHLFATDRPEAAKEVSTLVERIDENAAPLPTEALCLPLYDDWQNLGCLFEITP